MKSIKQHWKFLLFVCLIGLVGGIFTSIYLLEMLNEAQLASAVEQVGSITALQCITVLQTTLYAVIFGVFGLILSHKAGLWKTISFQKSILFKVVIISVVLGVIVAILDNQVFSMLIPQVAAEKQKAPSFPYIVAAFTYGAVVEEVMLRLFFMSLFAFGIYKIFYRKEESVPVKVFSVANIIAALLFALGHLPATSALYGELTSSMVIRSILFNGGFGLLFGFFYRKHGIHYAMLAHFGAHIGMISVNTCTALMAQGM
jgi:hypothetical protein